MNTSKKLTQSDTVQTLASSLDVRSAPKPQPTKVDISSQTASHSPTSLGLSTIPPPSYHTQAATGTTSSHDRYDARQASSDMSLHTLAPTTLSKSQQQRLVQIVQGHSSVKSHIAKGHGPGSWRGPTIDGDDEGSFFTARGTVRSIVPNPSGEPLKDGEEPETVDQEVLGLVHDRSNSTSSRNKTRPHDYAQQSPQHDQEWSYGETPAPSRVLYLFHPPPATSTSAGTNGLAGSLGNLGVSVDPWGWLDSARESLERAFWGILMPSVSGVVGATEAVSTSLVNFMTLLPIPASLAIEGTVAWQASTSIQTPLEETPRVWEGDATYRFQAAASLRGSPLPSPASSPPGSIRTKQSHGPRQNARLYDQETLYTLRLPQLESPPTLSSGEQDIGIGPTLRPVHVRKRAALPWHDTAHEERDRVDGRSEIGWGREPTMGMGLGMGMGMRV